MKALKLIGLLAKHGLETEVYMTSHVDQGTATRAVDHVGHDKGGNLVLTYSDELVVKTREDRYRVYREAQEARKAREAREAREARALADKYREAQEALADKYQDQDQEGQDQALADKYREVRKAQALAQETQEAREVETLTLALAQEVREVRKAQADKYHKALADKALVDKAQRNAKLARELTLARVDALWHWEDCFLTGVVDDEHRVFIAEVLAEAAHALEENDNER
jgi:hypothetical protein